MKGNKHREFLKRIRLPEEEWSEKSGGYQGTQRNPAHKMTGQAQTDLHKELERRIDELFGLVSED